MATTTPKPFRISVSEELHSFVTQRVATARIPPGVNFPPGREWEDGPPPDVVSHYKEYWKSKYDWRAVEAKLNSEMDMFTIPIEEADEVLTIHFVHQRSPHDGAIPLLFQHGWPGSFLEVQKILPLLTNPSEPGQQAYHVIAPSLPGYAFSSGPIKPGFSLKNMANVDAKLMQALGYQKYMVQGGDWGSLITQIMAINYPGSVLACHSNMIVGRLPDWLWSPWTFVKAYVWAAMQSEDSLFGRAMWWIKKESGYADIQSTKPQALAYGLTDSPLGQLAWILDKIHALVDEEFMLDEEELITWTMMYIIPTPFSSGAIYKNVKEPLLTRMQADIRRPVVPSSVAFGASIFPKEVNYAPRWWAQNCVAKNILFWREHDRGGHFAATERPDALVRDIRDFTALLDDGIARELRNAGP